MRYFLELGEDGEDEGEHAEERGGEAELRALAQSHGAGAGRSVVPCLNKRWCCCCCSLDLSACPGSIGVPEDGTATRLTAILRSAMDVMFSVADLICR